MGRQTYTPEQIINKLRVTEVLLSQGSSAGEASKRIGVTEQTLRLRSGQAPLSLAQRVWWHAGRASQEIEGAGEGELSA